MSLRIRSIGDGDAQAVTDIESRCFTEHHGYMQGVNRANYQVAIEAGKVVGFIAYTQRPTGKAIWIHCLAVDPDYQRQHIGSDLIRRMRYLCNYVFRRHIFVMVNANDLPAQQFFKAVGFRVIRQEKKVFGETDGYLFRFEFCQAVRIEPRVRLAAA